METAVSAFGSRIKEIRKKKKMTLNQVSERSDVSVSTLSKIETGQINGSVDTIFKIARGLGVLFNNLVPSQSAAAPTGRRVITRRSDAERFPTEIYDYAVHSADLVSRSMVPLLMTIKTRQLPDFCDWSTHGGEEFVFVVRGAIEFHTEHYAPVRLEHGDSVHFDSLMRHAFVTVGGGSEAVIVSVSRSDTRALWDGDEPWRPGPRLCRGRAATAGARWRLERREDQRDQGSKHAPEDAIRRRNKKTQ